MRIDAPPAKTEGLAVVEASFDTGSLIFRGPNGDVSLVWGSKQKDRRRALDPGEYRLRTTRIERTEDGTHWFLSSTGPPGERRELAADTTTKLTIEPSVHFKCHVKPKKKGLQLGFGIMTADHRGLSIYKNDKRVPVTYCVLDAKGKKLATGTMNYG